MTKKFLIILLSSLFLYAADNTSDMPNTSDKTNNNVSIARDKSGFFIGGVLGYAFFDRDLSVDGFRKNIDVVPSVINAFSCQKMPDGSTKCSGTGGVHITTGGTSVSTTSINTKFYTSESSISYGGRFGYNYFFTPRNGFRFIAAFTSANLKITPNKYSAFQDSIDSPYYMVSAGVDYLFDFTKGRSPFGCGV